MNLLSESNLRRLSKGNAGQYHFDFSTIHCDQYEVLFRTLQRFAVTEVDSLGFSCDELALCDRQNEALMPLNVQASIARRKLHYIRNMVELLCYLIGKSTRLSDIQFSNLIIRREHIDRLSATFGRSKYLKSLSLTSVLIGDDGLRALLHGLNPNVIEIMSIIKCGITGLSTDAIINFINRRTDPKVGIRVFQVSPSEVSDAHRRRIIASLTGIQESVAPDAFEDDGPDVEQIERSARIDELRSDNKSLRDQIRALREMANAVRFNDSVFVVGKGAPDFVLYLNEIEQRLVALDSRRRGY
jgi:hypothetical protein